MITIRLLYLNGEQCGQRIRVPSESATIGRSRSSDIRLLSRSVSRIHCRIRLEDEIVTLEDLGSRNGTVVGNVNLEPNEPARLNHHDIIRIGRFAFRISIRDRVTGKALRIDSPHQDSPANDRLDESSVAPDHTSGNELLDELDRLADDLRIDPVSSDTVEVPPSILGTVQPRKESVAATGDPTHPEPGIHSEPELSENQQANQQANQPADEAEKATSGSADAGETGNDKREPGKLPAHLRAKLAATSQEAAESAIKRLFTR